MESFTEKKDNTVFESYRIFDSFEYPVLLIASDGTTEYYNSSFKKHFLLNEIHSTLDQNHPFYSDYKKTIAQAYKGARNGSFKKCFAVIKDSSGASRAVEVYLFPLESSTEFKPVLSLFRMVDDRLMSFNSPTLSMLSSESNIYESLIFEFAPLAVVRLDDNYEIVKMSRAAEDITGYSTNNNARSTTVKASSFFKNDFDRLKKTVQKLSESGLAHSRFGLIKIIASNGSEKTAEVSILKSVMSDYSVYYDVIIEDVTEITELKARLDENVRMMMLNEIIGAFFHSMNNSLNVIMSKSQLLLQLSEKQQITEGLTTIDGSAHEIAEQAKRIQGLLSSIEDANSERTESLVEIIEDSVEFCRMRFKIDEWQNKRKVRVEKKYFTSPGVKTDTRLLRELITTLIFKVSTVVGEAGTINVSLNENGALEIDILVIKDNSAAEPAALKKEGFFSGLDIHSASEKLKIKVIEEESNEKYSIKIVLPKNISFDTVRLQEGTPAFKIRELDIMIVEDEPILRVILSELFDKMGNTVYTCENGSDALEEFKRKRYDIVISDYDIKGINGLELFLKIKELDDSTLAVLLSGWALKAIDIYATVVDIYMSKPFKLDEMIRMVSRKMADRPKKKA